MKTLITKKILSIPLIEKFPLTGFGWPNVGFRILSATVSSFMALLIIFLMSKALDLVTGNVLTLKLTVKEESLKFLKILITFNNYLLINTLKVLMIFHLFRLHHYQN